MFASQEDALVALITSIELSGNAINNPVYDKAYAQLNAIRGVSSHIKSEFKTIDFSSINFSDVPDLDKSNSKESYEKLGKDIVDSLISGFEKELDMLNDEISLLGKIDTNKEKQKQVEIIQEIIGVLNEELVAVQKKIPEIQSEISTATGKKLEELNSALDTLVKKERTIRIDIIANTEKIEDIINDVANDFIKIQKQNDEYIVNKRIESYKAELDALESIKEVEDEITERQERQLALQKAQERLTNAEREKNVRIYQNGEWQWISDPKEIKSAKEDVEKAQQDLLEFEKKMSLKHQREVIEKKIKDEQQAFENHYSNMEKLTSDYLDNLKKIYGDKWSEILNILATNINQAKSLQNDLLNSIITPTNVNTSYQPVTNASPSTGGVTGTAPKFGQSFLRSYDSGGKIEETGLALVHEGEFMLNHDMLKNVVDFVTNPLKYFSNINIKLPNFIPNINTQNKTIENHYHFENLNIQANDPSEMFRKLNMLIEQYT